MCLFRSPVYHAFALVWLFIVQGDEEIFECSWLSNFCQPLTNESSSIPISFHLASSVCVFLCHSLEMIWSMSNQESWGVCVCWGWAFAVVGKGIFSKDHGIFSDAPKSGASRLHCEDLLLSRQNLALLLTPGSRIGLTAVSHIQTISLGKGNWQKRPNKGS